MAMNFEYDDSGETFTYFLLAVVGLLLAPLTYFSIGRGEKKEDKVIGVGCNCEPCREKLTRLLQEKPGHRLKKIGIQILLCAGWALFAYLAFKAFTTERHVVEWNPYDVLGVDSGATMAEVRKAYRKLSLTHHPDRGGDQEKFVKISKAYQALTDDEARDNWEKYGNPDGPGVMTFGIALPSWIVDKRYSLWVLLAYVIVFMVILPTAVGLWWYRSNQYSSPEILVDTQRLYMHFFSRSPSMMLKRIIMVLSSSFEFEKGHNPEVKERESDNIDLPILMGELGDIGQATKERPFGNVSSVKARVLIYSHLDRLTLPSYEVQHDMDFTVRKCPTLISNMVSTCATLTSLHAYGRISRPPSIDTLENVIRISQRMVQALSLTTRSPLLQLPHFSDRLLRHFFTKKRSVKSAYQLLKLSDEDRRALVREMSDQEYEDVVRVASAQPRVEITTKLHVLDDEDPTLTAGAIVTASVELKRWNLGDFVAAGKEAASLEEDAAEAADEPNVRGKGGKGGKGGKPKIGGGNTTNNKKNNKRRGKENARPAPPVKTIKAAPKKSPENSGGNADDSDSDAPTGTANETKKKDTNKDDDSDFDADIPDDLKEDRDIVPETKSRESHSVHAPYFPDDKQEWWWLYLCDRRTKRLISPPRVITDLVAEQKVKVQFPAPEKAGQYAYSVVLRSDSYLDCDVVENVKFTVHAAKQPIASHPQWNISDSEEEPESEDELATDTDSE